MGDHLSISGNHLKHSIKDSSIAYSVKRRKTYKKVLRNIEREISELENLPYHLIDMNKKRKSFK